MTCLKRRCQGAFEGEFGNQEHLQPLASLRLIHFHSSKLRSKTTIRIVRNKSAGQLKIDSDCGVDSVNRGALVGGRLHRSSRSEFASS